MPIGSVVMGKCRKKEKTMNNRLLILLILVLSSLKGLCNEDYYSYKTYGNLNVKIASNENITLDKAFKSAEFSSYLTNQLCPDKKVYLEIYTLGIDDNEDFFVSYGNGKKEVYNNYDKTDRKGKTTKIRQFVTIDSLKYDGIVIRYMSKKPDYKKLMRLIYSSVNKLEYIKNQQKQVTYNWSSLDWTFSSIDTLVTLKWTTITKFDKLIANTLKNKVFISEACKNENGFAFTYHCSTDEYKIYSKTDNEFKGIVLKELIWFNINQNYGIFINSDSTFYIADSQNNNISNLLSVPIKFSNFQNTIFFKKSENILQLFVVKVNKNHKDEILKWIYLIEEKKLINETETERIIVYIGKNRQK
jgi:hypothetical protein